MPLHRLMSRWEKDNAIELMQDAARQASLSAGATRLARRCGWTSFVKRHNGNGKALRSLSREWNAMSAEEQQRYVPPENPGNDPQPELQAEPLQMPPSAPPPIGPGSADEPLQKTHLEAVAQRASYNG